MSLAGRLFDGRDAEGELEALLEREGVPFEELGWDSYDSSVEIHGVPPEYRLSKGAREALHKTGFATIYMNHTDRWETHYSHKGGPGWRVSYPHKRGDGGAIWVEEVCPTWPADWFKTGYAVVRTNQEGDYPKTPKVTDPIKNPGAP